MSDTIHIQIDRADGSLQRLIGLVERRGFHIDGMALAAESYPDQILDVATLTGACVVALGPQIFGVMGNDDDVRAQVADASAAVDEPSWPLPLPADLRPGLQGVARIELPAEAAPNDPPEPAEGGSALSPSTVVTRSTGKPSASAAIWVRIA